MAQFARPDSDVSDGTWQNQAGSQTNMYQSIDESSVDDADYIRTTMATGTESTTFGSSNVTDPVSSSGHTVRWRARVVNLVDDTINLSITLRQGGTLIATARSGAITDASFTDGSYTLSGAEADAITDYTALNFMFVKTGTNDDAGIRVEVSFVELEVPDVAGSTPIAAIAGSQYRRRRG